MEEIVKNELSFYSKLGKPLILNLPCSKDRILASAWIKKFWDEKAGPEKLRTNYLKLLLFSLQRRRLVGIFADDPANYEILEDFPLDYNLNELARNLIEQEQEDKKEKYQKEMVGDMEVFPPISTDCSPDLTEYVAAQDIPNFGVHCYYAISKEPIHKWQQHEKAILPKGTKSAVDTSQSPLDIAKTLSESRTASPIATSLAEQPGLDENAAGEKNQSPSRKRKHSPQKFGKRPPTQPMGVVKTPEERLTPTWGSNLLHVRETVTSGTDQEEEFFDQNIESFDASMPEFLREDEMEIISNVDEIRQSMSEWKKGRIETKRPKLKKSRPGIPRPRPPSGIPKTGHGWATSTRIAETTQIGQSKTKTPNIQEKTIIQLDPNMTDLANFVEEGISWYEQGVIEDEGLACKLIEKHETQAGHREVTRNIQQIKDVTPAIAKGVPVITPKPYPSPRRQKCQERLFTEPSDELILTEQPPLGIPPVGKRKKLGFTEPPIQKSEEPLSQPRRGEIKEISEVFKEMKNTVRQGDRDRRQVQSKENREKPEEKSRTTIRTNTTIQGGTKDTKKEKLPK